MNILTVSQLNGYVKSMLEENVLLGDIIVAGEISNFKSHSSGHLYFSLKDESGAISAAMFKWQRIRLKFAPQNGMKVLAQGKITLYEPSGQYQLVVSSLQPDGIGALYAAFEQLKEKLYKEGLFEVSRKKPIPAMPSKIGVVTSKTGAAVQDILNILARRYPMAQVVLCPVLVQGEEAPGQIAGAIRLLNRKSACDVMIVGRGGGSVEDLWAFNTEIVARAVAQSEIPVISAVGHETDTTICDYVADLRAPTPSAAAELAVPDSAAIIRNIESVMSDAMSSIRLRKAELSARLESVMARQCLKSPLFFVESKAQRADRAWSRVSDCTAASVAEAKQSVAAAAHRLAALNPMAVLARGYCMATDGSGVISSVADIRRSETFTIKFSDGEETCKVVGNGEV